MKSVFALSAATILLAACASPGGADTDKQANMREERNVTVGSYLPRKNGQSPGNAGTVDKTELENMTRMGEASIERR